MHNYSIKIISLFIIRESPYCSILRLSIHSTTPLPHCQNMVNASNQPITEKVYCYNFENGDEILQDHFHPGENYTAPQPTNGPIPICILAKLDRGCSGMTSSVFTIFRLLTVLPHFFFFLCIDFSKNHSTGLILLSSSTGFRTSTIGHRL